MRKVLIGLVLLAAPAVAFAQSFGVTMGAPVTAYHSKMSGSSPYAFQIQVPEPNSEFESYIAIATPSNGICKVTGIGRTHTNDDYGTEIRATFSRMRDALSDKYGANRQFDYIKSGALWDKPRDWVWSIYKKERTLVAYWLAENGSSLPATIEAIELVTRSVSPTSGAYLSLTYELSNYDECKKILDGHDNSGL
jgi:hypothetical protein